MSKDHGVEASALAAEIAGQSVLEFSVAQRIGKFAREITQHHDAASALSSLSALRDACHDSNTKAMVLNNIASLERQLGRLADALASLQLAVKLEGGMSRALPTTLVNLSAVLHSCGKFTEAAAVANKAISHLQRTQSRPGTPAYASSAGSAQAGKTLAAAYFNLGAALEGTNQSAFAQEAYSEVLAVVSDPKDPYVIAAQQALNALSLGGQRSDQEEWAATVAPFVAQQAANPKRYVRAPKRNAQQRFPALLPPPPRAQSSMSTANDASAGVVAVRAASAMDTGNSFSSQRRSRHDAAATYIAPQSTIRDDIAQVYHGPIRKYHSLPPLLSPVPYEERLANADNHNNTLLSASRVSAALAGNASSSSLVHLPASEMPDWNPDPVLKKHALSYHVANAADKRNWALIHEVDVRFIPRALVPLVEDMRYKEGTRRTMIIKEWKRRFDVIRRARDIATFTAAEDNERVLIEVEEARVRRVLKQWIVGKLLFAEATLRLDKDEAHVRDTIVKDVLYACHLTQLQANLLHPQAVEEVGRAVIVAEERAARSRLIVDKEASTTLVQSRLITRQNVSGIAYALALWCLEGVVPEQDVPLLEDASRKQSIVVLERFSVFGKQRRPS